ncbi:MAG TPA: sigma-54 dependent transcriptional regulator [Pirellulales bacterium]|nr:sigma-54 dependent transcriptional regulator [Pirellulales bacterium]
MHARLLLADDEPLFLNTTAQLLRRKGYDCVCVNSASAAMQALEREPFDAALVDLNMPGNLGLELLRSGREQFPRVPLIVVTGAPSLPSAIESVRLGIADYILKPVALEALLASVGRIVDRHREATPATTSGKTQRPEILGQSDAIQRVIEIVHRVAESDINVLISGENGTGKEVVARAIHDLSRRRRGPFQTIDCAAVPESLFESTLFGHARGAFTGAVAEQPGLLRRCDRGTAFFDELGELPLAMQSKLLRALQFRRFTPVGQHTEVEIDARFISATNRDLEAAIAQAMFRRDLYYRLAVVHVRMPPLRERGDDVLMFAEHFLAEAAAIGGRASSIAEDVLQLFRGYAWPGNIRELSNVIFRASSLCEGTQIGLADLPDELRDLARSGTRSRPMTGNSRREIVVSAERNYLIRILGRHGGNVTQAAREAGLSRQGLYKLMHKHQLRSQEFRDRR